MCTAVTYKTKDFYFGRTLDYDHSYAEQVTVTPRHFPLSFRFMDTLNEHHAMIGMAHTEQNYPLYYDAVNEKGLAMAGLNFVGNAAYNKVSNSADNVASFEFIPWILGQCATVNEAKALMDHMNLTDTAFSKQVPPAQLHWLIADANEAITVESMQNGFHIHKNEVGVLTNNPPFHQQIFHLNNYMQLSPNDPNNLFSDKVNLQRYSRGMGAIGLPGDLSSQSRFVRAVFTKLNSVAGNSEEESVSQYFHILDTVSQTRGSCRLGEGSYEITIYSSCCNATKGIYYYTTYGNRQITAIHMHKTDLSSSTMFQYPLITRQQIFVQN